MSTIRVVGGTGWGPTAVAAYDAALADAGVHNYNLMHVSSVIPAGSTIEHRESAPDLGPVGEKLTVVEARATVEAGVGGQEAGRSACAGLGWAVDEHGRGLFYEASGRDAESVHEAVERGLAAGRELREWPFVDERVVVESTIDESADDGEFTVAVMLGVYGESKPIL